MKISASEIVALLIAAASFGAPFLLITAPEAPAVLFFVLFYSPFWIVAYAAIRAFFGERAKRLGSKEKKTV